ncbi:MAG: ABC transporter permease subunit [Erysipelotrichales bacterium]|nr:ABC transporter permease subunit [Erysipelotrichales bacterium]
MKDSSSISSKIASLISVGLVFVLIFVISNSKNDPQIYPSLNVIANKLIDNITNIGTIKIFLLTIIRVFLALVASLITSFVISLLYYYNKLTMDFLKPILAIMKAAPLAAIAIYIFLVVRGEVGKPLQPYLVTYLVTLPIILEGFIGSIDNMPDSIINELKITKGTKFYKYIKVYFPLMIPNIIITLLQTIGLGFKVMIMAEYLCYTKSSVGVLIYNAYSVLDMAQLIAVIIEIVIIVLVGEFVIKQIKKKIHTY